MVTRDVHLPVAAQSSIDDFVEQTLYAEERGYDRAWIPETWGRNAVSILTRAADRTDTIGLGTSILPVYSRSPALIGQTAATLQEASDGRFRLGLGPSGPIVIEHWHGVEFGNPLRRTREYVDVVRQVLSGEEVDYDGEYFDLSGFRLRSAPPETPPSIDVAAMGPKAVELAGRFADGWHAIVFTQDGLRDRLEDLRRGADLGERDADDVRVTLSLTCCALEDGDRARDLVRQHMAFYVGAMGDYYRESLARQGYEDVATEVTDRWGDGDREGAKAAIGDDLLDDLAIAGTPERARERFAEWDEIDGLDAVAVGFPRAADRSDIESTMDVLAP